MSAMQELAKALRDFISPVEGRGEIPQLATKPSPGAIKCELDGEPIGGVCLASIEIERDGNVRLMLFTDPVQRMPWYGEDVNLLKAAREPCPLA